MDSTSTALQGLTGTLIGRLMDGRLVHRQFNFPSSTSCKIIAAVNIFVIEPIRYLFAAVKGFFSVPLIWQ